MGVQAPLPSFHALSAELFALEYLNSISQGDICSNIKVGLEYFPRVNISSQIEGIATHSFNPTEEIMIIMSLYSNKN